MRTGVKVAAAVLGILLVVCLLSAIGFFLSGTGRKVLGLTQKVSQFVGTAREFEALEKAHPFTPPPDGSLAEERLLAYLEVSEAVGPEARRYADWIRSHQEAGTKEGEGLGVAVEAMDLIKALLGRFLEELRAHGMCLKEFRYVQRVAEESLRELGEGPATALNRDLLAALEEASRLPGLREGERSALQKKVQEFRDRMGLSGEPLSPNAALAARYRDRIRAAELPPEARALLLGAADGGRSPAPVIHLD